MDIRQNFAPEVIFHLWTSKTLSWNLSFYSQNGVPSNPQPVPQPSTRTEETAGVLENPNSALQIDSICRAETATRLGQVDRKPNAAQTSKYEEEGGLVTLNTNPSVFLHL